jgi:hypothetical protein
MSKLVPGCSFISTTGDYRSPATYAEHVERCRKLLRLLGEIVPEFSRVAVLDGLTYQPIDLGSDQLAAQLSCGFSDELRRYPGDFAALTPDGKIGAETGCTKGWTQRFFTAFANPDEIVHPGAPGARYELMVAGGGGAAESSQMCTSLTLPEDRLTHCHTAEFFLDWIRRVGSVDGAIAAHFQASDFSRRVLSEVPVREGEDPHTRLIDSWIRCFPISDLTECLPAEVSAFRVEQGTVIQSTSGFPDSSSEDDLGVGRRVRAALEDLGLADAWPRSVFGWPPNAEEIAYCQYITGAPPHTKYRVRCVDFDGYDHERKVLLMARLFREVARYKPTHVYGPSVRAIVNEAHRQIYAVQKSGRGHPIEWRAGLKDGYQGVRAVLDRYVPEHKGRIEVIYQPLEDVLKAIEQERRAQGAPS